jgi:hypothetical protein
MTKIRASVVAQRLLNLYRQAHVIEGGWGAVNRVLVVEFDDSVAAELEKLPNGKTLITHIKNLKSGRTNMSGIESELLPYGGAMEMYRAYELSEIEISGIKTALNEFEFSRAGLQKILNLNIVKRFGDNWFDAIKSAVVGDAELLKKLESVRSAKRAYEIWDSASALNAAQASDRVRNAIAAQMMEFDIYLPMFGENGSALLAELKKK